MSFIKNNKGQTSIELFILILAVVLGGVIVASNVPKLEFNTTGIQDAKDITFGGFIHEGGSPVSSSGSGSDMENTNTTNNNTNNNNNNNTNTTIGGGGRAEYLTVTLSGKSEVNMRSEVIPNAELLSGYVEINNDDFTNVDNRHFNVEGNITGEITMDTTEEKVLYLGSLSEIGTLNLNLGGESNLNIVNVQQIDYISADEITNYAEFTTLNTNINIMDIGGVNENSKLTFDNVHINMSRIGGIGGGISSSVELNIENSDIGTLEIGGINGGILSSVELNIENSTIGTLDIGGITPGISSNPKIIIKNSIINDVTGVDITNCNQAQVTIENSIIEGVEYN